MRKFLTLLIIIIAFSACKKDLNETQEEKLPTGVNVKVQLQKKLSTGEIRIDDFSSFIYIFDESNKTLIINPNPTSEKPLNFALNTKTNQLEPAVSQSGIASSFSAELPPGKYFVVVGLIAYPGLWDAPNSSQHFTIEKNKTTELKKIFSYNITGSSYEKWEINQ